MENILTPNTNEIYRLKYIKSKIYISALARFTTLDRDNFLSKDREVVKGVGELSNAWLNTLWRHFLLIFQQRYSKGVQEKEFFVFANKEWGNGNKM